MKIAKAIFRNGALGDQQRRVGSKSARPHEAAFSLRSPSSYSGGVGGGFFQQTFEKKTEILENSLPGQRLFRF